MDVAVACLGLVVSYKSVYSCCFKQLLLARLQLQF